MSQDVEKYEEAKEVEIGQNESIHVISVSSWYERISDILIIEEERLRQLKLYIMSKFRLIVRIRHKPMFHLQREPKPRQEEEMVTLYIII